MVINIIDHDADAGLAAGLALGGNTVRFVRGAIAKANAVRPWGKA
jgi:hypothetical protein